MRALWDDPLLSRSADVARRAHGLICAMCHRRWVLHRHRHAFRVISILKVYICPPHCSFLSSKTASSSFGVVVVLVEATRGRTCSVFMDSESRSPGWEVGGVTSWLQLLSSVYQGVLLTWIHRAIKALISMEPLIYLPLG